MKVSVIIPCHPSSRPTLPRTLRSLARASSGLDVETLVVDDDESRGPSWARNRGLDRASGEVVFFCDADDEVEPDFFRAPLEALGRTAAEMCLFGYNGTLPRRAYDLTDNAAVRSVFLPTVFGYSFDDVRRWNRGGRLWDSRELATVWRVAFRRDFLERFRLRFDESVGFCEDAMFLSECAVRCGRMTSVARSLYAYRPTPAGLIAASSRSEVRWRYKFQMQAFRRRLDREFGGLWSVCEASAVFSAVELLKARRDWRGYVADPLVAEAIRRFPVSIRHPLVAAAVAALRLYLSTRRST